MTGLIRINLTIAGAESIGSVLWLVESENQSVEEEQDLGFL